MANSLLPLVVGKSALAEMHIEQIERVENAAGDAETGILLALSIIGRLANQAIHNDCYGADDARHDLAAISTVLMTLPDLLGAVKDVKDNAVYLLSGEGRADV
jgi:hypothetical protein